MSPKVSVIIPAYNAGNFIRNAINSVLTQKYILESQVIVIDDGSSDDTNAIITKMSHYHQQLTCVPNSREKGPSGARNAGLLRASGDYVAFLDADDV